RLRARHRRASRPSAHPLLMTLTLVGLSHQSTPVAVRERAFVPLPEAAELASMVPGEGEILGQVREAYEAGAPGAILDRLFRQALHAGKKVRAETAIGENPASVSSAAAALAQQVFGDLEGCRVLLVGAGHVAELSARSLVARGAQVVYVANRSAERGQALAARFGGTAIGLEQAAAH